MNAGDNGILNRATLNSYFVETSQTIIFSVLFFQFHNQLNFDANLRRPTRNAVLTYLAAASLF